ncbi:MAG: PEGA domain-containing protein [Myxococcales bacterium]|nr:PEGA domain-containing protein [Myxococcales bacterium]
MIRSTLTLIALLPATALAAPVAVAPELVPGNGVPAAIGKQFDATFRQELSRKTTLIDQGPTAAALGKIGDSACNSDDCGRALATAVNARFVITATVSATDDIYEVKLTVFDAARNERSKVVSGVCELCTAGEVNGTISNAVSRLDEALAKEAAPAAPVKVEIQKPKTVAFELKSTPSGASVLVDGKPSGATPVKLELAPGSHKIQISKDGFTPATRMVALESEPLNLMVNLEPVKAVVAVAPPTAAPAAPPLAAPPTAAPAAPPTADVPVAAPPATGPGKYNGVAWGMTIGGLALAGVGTWLIVLDGDVTCTDGRGRATCPTVYNTKGVGIAGLGIGAALVGAAVAILAVGPAEEPAVMPAVEATPGGAAILLGGSF